ncbi:MAG: hypothetical protein CMH26_04500 [Micavibrio sp.]|nr:hypothetical protein [Micavibrio sp.]
MSNENDELRILLLGEFKKLDSALGKLHVPRNDKDQISKKLKGVCAYLESADEQTLQVQHDLILPTYKHLVRLLKQNTKDPLTSLPQRASLEPTFEHVVQRMNDGKIGSATMAIGDANDFKTVNEYFGHPVGDRVLKTYANIMRESLPESDYVARLGGDEFVIIIEHKKSKPDDENNVDWVNPRAIEILQTIQDNISAAELYADRHDKKKIRVPLAITFGVANINPNLSLDQNYTSADNISLNNKAYKKDIYAEIRRDFQPLSKQQNQSAHTPDLPTSPK